MEDGRGDTEEREGLISDDWRYGIVGTADEGPDEMVRRRRRSNDFSGLEGVQIFQGEIADSSGEDRQERTRRRHSVKPKLPCLLFG